VSTLEKYIFTNNIKNMKLNTPLLIIRFLFGIMSFEAIKKTSWPKKKNSCSKTPRVNTHFGILHIFNFYCLQGLTKRVDHTQLKHKLYSRTDMWLENAA